MARRGGAVDCGARAPCLASAADATADATARPIRLRRPTRPPEPPVFRGRRHRPAARQGARRRSSRRSAPRPTACRRQAIETLPAGENTPLNQVMLQAPGVAQDSFGQLHIRGEHNGLQYRLNGVILPEGLSVFSQALEPAARRQGRADHRRPAGRVRPAHRRHHRHHHQERRLRQRRRGVDLRRQPRRDRAQLRVRRLVREPQLLRLAAATCTTTSASSRPTAARTRCTTTPSSSRASPTSRTSSIRTSRVSLILGTSDQRFQIPERRRASAERRTRPDACNGQTDFPEPGPQREPAREHPVRRRQLPAHDRPLHRPGLAVRALFDAEVHARSRSATSSTTASPRSRDKTDLAGGVQAEGVYDLNDAAHAARRRDRRGRPLDQRHHLAGAAARRDRPADRRSARSATSRSPSSTTAPRPPRPTASICRTSGSSLDDLTLNYGLRFDQFDGFRDENQLSPRVNLVWQPTADDHLPCRLCPLLLAAAVRAGRQRDGAEVRRADPRQPDITTTAAPAVDHRHHAVRRARQLLRRRRVAEVRRALHRRPSTATTRSPST